MGRILGLDIGDRRIGVAVSDPLKIIASPHSVIDRKIEPDVVQAISLLISELNIESILIGLPLTMKGTLSDQTRKVLEFIELLASNFSIPIQTVDERLSSVAAKKSLILQGIKTGYEKGEIDKTSAAIFLQEYLDSQ